MFKQLVCSFAGLALSALGLATLGGCAGAKVSPTVRAGAIPKPDLIVINDFAVTPSEVKLDKGVLATAMRDAKHGSPTQEEEQLGHMVSEKLAQTLVEELRKDGIPAARPRNNPKTTDTTAFLSGQFITIDQGNQSARVWVGFGLGGSELRTRVQVAQGGELVAEAETATKSSLKPGMLVSLGTGSAAGSGASIAAGAIGGGVSETLLATVEADASRTAKEVAKKIRQAYVDRGWMAR
jgi:hypothetical protein